MNSRIKLPLANLLNEKGYPFEFITVGELKEVPLHIPTIVEVVMWIYEKHGIWISAGIITINGDVKFFPQYNIIHDYSGNVMVEQTQQTPRNFDLPDEAYLSAIEYVLTNLI